MKLTYIDVREPDEFAAGHVDGAINIPLGAVVSNSTVMQALPKDGEYILYCRSGGRAGIAEDAMQKMGYTHVTNGINQAAVEASL